MFAWLVALRYYDPVVGRFVNADTPEFGLIAFNILGHNIFSYCVNNPVNNKDDDGYIVANIIGAVIGAIGGYIVTNWLADNFSLKGWKRKIFVFGLSSLVGAVATTIGYFVGPYIAKVWYALRAKLSGLIRNLFRSINNISTTRMNHINVSKYLWKNVLGKKNSNVNIKNLIYRAIRNGQWHVLDNGIIAIRWEYAGEIIEITGNVVNGIFYVGDAWVWNGVSKLLW